MSPDSSRRSSQVAASETVRKKQARNPAYAAFLAHILTDLLISVFDQMIECTCSAADQSTGTGPFSATRNRADSSAYRGWSGNAEDHRSGRMTVVRFSVVFCSCYADSR